MDKPKECKFCRETEFKFHESTKIYNPETDEREDINNVYQCTTCGGYFFETEKYAISHLEKDPGVSGYTPKLADYMNS